MKKLVYHFFILKDWRDNPIYKLHLNCLKYYQDCFDEAYFALCLEDPNDVESLNEIRSKLNFIFKHVKKVTFETVQNTMLRETETFKREVVDKLGQDDLVFFGHTQGITSFDRNDFEFTSRRVCGLYYFSLNDEKKTNNVVRLLSGGLDTISFGSYLFKCTYKTHVKNMYEWHYAGTFFWINTKRLKEYIKNNNKTLPLLSDRYYDENFLGNIFPMYDGIEDNDEHGFMLAGSYNQKYYYCSTPNFPDILGNLNFLIEGEEDEFNEFIHLMLN